MSPLARAGWAGFIMRRLFNRPQVLSVFLLAASLLAALPVRAQAGKPRALLSAVDAGAFPAMQAYALVNDAAGKAVAGLADRNFTLTENGQPVAGLQTAQAEVGVQVVFVLDSSAAFKIRDGNGVTRLDYIKQALADFAQNKPWMRNGVDDVTVAAAEAPVVEHSNDAGVVAHAVAGYQSTFAGVADSFTLVNGALGFASDATRRPGMRRFVIFISAGFQRPDVQGQVADAAARATSAGVPVYTVYVGPFGAGNTLPAQNLKKLADATGGQALILETPQSLTPIFQMVSDQGRQYRLSYRSRLAATGQNRLSLAVQLADGTAISATETTFPLRVEAPHINLGSLPTSLVRVAAATSGVAAAAADANPRAYDVPVSIDFPDGHVRNLSQVQLLVDNQVVATQANSSSVASLIWPLSAYSLSAPHRLQARVVDELGLAAESQVVVVNVSLQVPAGQAPVPASVAAMANINLPLLALALGGLVLAAAVGGVWYARARRPAPAQPAPSRPRAQVKTGPLPPAAGLEATVPMAPAGKSQPNGHSAPARHSLPHVALPSWRWPSRHGHAGPRGAAFLKVVEPGGGGAPQPNIELQAASLTLGRDGALAETVFHDRSVSRLHARIVAEDGSYRIFDSGSTSGTWVNYSPIPVEGGQALQDGDLINLGRVQLRFQRRDQAAGKSANGARVALVAGAAPAAPAAPTEQAAKDGL